MNLSIIDELTYLTINCEILKKKHGRPRKLLIKALYLTSLSTVSENVERDRPAKIILAIPTSCPS